IIEVSQNKQPILIAGELGTEKRSAALEIHQRSDRADTPFLLFDAETADAGGSPDGARHPDSLRMELAQESALFGHKKGAISFAKTRRLGLVEVGNEGTLLIEGVDHLALSVQRKLAAFIRTGHVYPLGSQSPAHSSARIVACTAIDLAERVQSGKFDPLLYELLTAQSIIVPPLRQRKRDLNLIVDYFVERYSEQAGKRMKEVEAGAYQQIMTYNWPGNIDELKVVIRRAVNLSPDDTLSPEHLFIGMAPVEGKITFNLLKTETAQRFFKSKMYPVLPQIVTILFFGLLMGMGYFAGQQADSNIAITLTWGFWEPMLALLWLLTARGWCAVCPLGAISEFLSRFFSLGLKVPSFIREYGFYVAAVGLCLIIWSEPTFCMFDSPKATAVLLTVLLSLTVTAGLLFRRRVWCRYLCPLGHFSGIMSRCSILEFRANTNVCNNDCPDHSCYTGNKDANGCPMLEGPFSMSSNQHCILCGNCIKACPKQSPRLNLRLPAYELWNVLKSDKILSIIIPLLIGTQLFRGFELSVFFHSLKGLFGPPWVGLSVAMILCLLVAGLFVNAAGSLAFQKLKDAALNKRDLFVYALVPLAFSFEFAYQAKLFLVYAGQLLPVLGRQLGYNWDVFGLGIDPGMIKILQIMCVLVGILASRAIMYSLARFHEEIFLERQARRKRWVILLPGVVYIILFVSAV
ncbi:MAG: 4Fe-4S binding protein, partial [Deltaproteobacteria bacterium]|nr:4Fe-4S binding protein [Deltaproteobacteria bacterium]